MKTYRVRATALTDLIAYFDVEAETPEEAKKIAESHLAGGHEDVDFQVADDGAAPICGTEEVESVVDQDENEELFDTVNSVYLENAVLSYRDGKNEVLAVDTRERDTILAALRYWQREGLMSAGMEIDALCERING